MKQIKNFLLSFDGRLDRKSFAVLVLPCLLFLVLISLLAIATASAMWLYFFDGILFLTLSPLIVLGISLFLMVYARIYTPVFLEEGGGVSVFNWPGIYISGIVLLLATVISYLFYLLTVKRLNDLNRSRKWILLSLVPFVNWLFLAYLLLFKPSDAKKLKE